MLSLGQTGQEADGLAGEAERVEIPLDGTRRDLQPSGQLTRGQGLMRLQQEQDPEQTFGTHAANMTGPGNFSF